MRLYTCIREVLCPNSQSVHSFRDVFSTGRLILILHLPVAYPAPSFRQSFRCDSAEFKLYVRPLRRMATIDMTTAAKGRFISALVQNGDGRCYSIINNKSICAIFTFQFVRSSLNVHVFQKLQLSDGIVAKPFIFTLGKGKTATFRSVHFVNPSLLF